MDTFGFVISLAILSFYTSAICILLKLRAPARAIPFLAIVTCAWYVLVFDMRVHKNVSEEAEEEAESIVIVSTPITRACKRLAAYVVALKNHLILTPIILCLAANSALELYVECLNTGANRVSVFSKDAASKIESAIATGNV